MKKLVAVAAVLFVSQSWAAGDYFINCETLVYCRALPGMMGRPYETPTILFETTAATPYVISAKVWEGSGCQGEVHHTCEGSGYLEYPGLNGLISDYKAEPGWEYSVQWTVEGCPEQPCVDGVIGEAPDTCDLPK